MPHYAFQPGDGEAILQYVRDHLILRTEAASTNVNDYGVNKAVENLPVLRKAMSPIV